MKRTEIKEALQLQELDKEINVKGWVRNKRGSKNVAFIALNDGSTINNLQLVIDLNVIPEESLALMHTGASVSATGNLVKSAGSGQNVEMNVTSIEPKYMNHLMRSHIMHNGLLIVIWQQALDGKDRGRPGHPEKVQYQHSGSEERKQTGFLYHPRYPAV